MDDEWRQVGFPVKGPDDLKKLRWLCSHMSYVFSVEDFERGSRFVGERGEPQFWLPKSPYQALAQSWMKLQDLIYALADNRPEVEATMKSIDASYDRLWGQILDYGQVRIANFGENIHDHLLSPRYFERYLIPWYEKRSNQLRRAGIFTHTSYRRLLPHAPALPEGSPVRRPGGADAPAPGRRLAGGDERAHRRQGPAGRHPGRPVSADLQPEQLMQTVERIVALFSPRLVLGVSDEVPQGADAVQAIAKLEMVADGAGNTNRRTSPKEGINDRMEGKRT